MAMATPMLSAAALTAMIMIPVSIRVQPKYAVMDSIRTVPGQIWTVRSPHHPQEDIRISSPMMARQPVSPAMKILPMRC
jgi:hypothetical protein